MMVISLAPVLLYLLIGNCVETSGQKVREYGETRKYPRARAGTDTWLFCHGMSIPDFKDTCSCMLRLKEEMVKRSVGNPKDVKLWPVIEDRIYSLQDCMESLKQIMMLNHTHTNETQNEIHSRQKRKFYNRSRYKWKSIVRYEFHKDLPADDKYMIREAVKHWEDQTCIQFEEFDMIRHSTRAQRLFFTNKPDGCYSYIGKQSTGYVIPQQVNLQSTGCTAWIGVVVHEIGHSLGLFHEQNRLDRDFWVIFYKSHVASKTLTNFYMEPDSRHLGIPYDYGSVMQYDNRAFSNGKGIVMEAILPYSEFTMGQRGFLSFLDAKIMNRAYCSTSCSQFDLPCRHGGYVDPNNCTTCRCPEGLGGRLCERAADSHPECNPQESFLVATSQLQCLESPGYHSRGYYNIGTKCNWMIHAPPGQRIRARFDGPFAVYCSANANRGPMCFHWVEIKFKKDKRIRGGRFCCYDSGSVRWNVPPKIDEYNTRGVVLSDDNMMVVHFDGSWPQAAIGATIKPSGAARRGFKLCFAISEDTVNDTQIVDPVDAWFAREVSGARGSLFTHGSAMQGSYAWLAGVTLILFTISQRYGYSL